MKRIWFLITIFCTITANAQNYLITFKGTGTSTTVSTVKVENLTKSTSLTLNGSDVLQLTVATGINSSENKQSSDLKIYPNPMIDNSTVEIFPPVAGDAIITVFDMTGKLAAKIKSYLENSPQEFRLSGFKSGFYLISVKGNSFQYTEKLLCNSNADGTISMEKISSNQAAKEKTEKTDYKKAQAIVDMAYNTGDRLKFTGISGNFSTVTTDIPAGDKTITFNFITCTDGDGNNYPVVEIGTQVWMAENLKTTKYKNGDLIGTTTPATKDISGESTPKYQWAYSGNESNVATFGRLYTWYAVTDNRNICPTGWHVPTDVEWHTLVLALDPSAVLSVTESTIAGGKLRETGIVHWKVLSPGTTNETGFTALPGGYRGFMGGAFDLIGYIGTGWSSTEYSTSHAWGRYVSCGTDVGVYRGKYDKTYGYSLRCVRD